jgi:hypothetical protein
VASGLLAIALTEYTWGSNNQILNPKTEPIQIGHKICTSRI